MANLEDHAFSLLLRTAAPLVVSTPGPPSLRLARLRGVARFGDANARVIFSNDPEARVGMGFQFPLLIDGSPLPADAALDWIRNTALADFEELAKRQNLVSDSHGNRILDSSLAEFDTKATPSYDHELFSLLSTLIHGGGFPWFEDVYTCAGFMLRPDGKVRIYLNVPAESAVWGIELPLVDGRGGAPMAFGSLTQELASLLRSGDPLPDRLTGGRDDYCVELFDMSGWIRPRDHT